jgi:uncharacterized protein (TIGR02246 family)
MIYNWKWSRVTVRTVVLISGIVVAGLLAYWTGGGSTRADEPVNIRPRAANPARAEDEKAIRKITEAFTNAFNAGDAKAVATLWAPEGELADVHGEVFRGRDAIEKMYGLQFSNAKGSKIKIAIDSIRFAGKETAIEAGTASVIPVDGHAVTAGRFTVVYVNSDRKWLMESVHESPFTSNSNYENLSDIEWMIGTWTANPPGSSVELKCEWVANRNFIHCTQSTKNGESVVGTSTQIIGWDPLHGRIRSWNFDSEGGFGSQLWTKDGKRWVLEATGVRRDSTVTEAANIITPVDGSTFTWQSVRRRVNGVEVADTVAIKAVRTAVKK